MRVLHIYSGNLYGGIETNLVTLALHRGLCPEMEPHFALCFEGRLSEELTAAGTPVFQLGNVRASQPVTVWRARRALNELLKRDLFDVVICHSSWSHAIFGPVVRRARRPLVFWLHGPVDGRHWTERWARRTAPDLALCNSKFTARTLPKLFPHTCVEVLYYPVAFSERPYPRDELMATRAELNTPEDAVVIIQVSRIEELKGHTVHLNALGMLKDITGWIYWQVGSPQRPHETAYLNELKSTAYELGIAERVRFVEQQIDIRNLMATSDIYCQPNTGPEGFGLTFVESLFVGLPVVTSAIGGALEIIDQTCGMLLPPGEAVDLAQSLRRLIKNSTLRESLGQAGPARARELCEPRKQLKRLNQLLVSVIHREVAA